MNRWLQLMLLMPEDEFITYKALSEELGISVRTVYDDISRLNEMVLEHGAQLVARPHHGVTLEVYDRSRSSAFWMHLAVAIRFLVIRRKRGSGKSFGHSSAVLLHARVIIFARHSISAVPR